MEASYSLQDLIQALADAAHDLTPGVASSASGNTNELRAASFGGKRPNQWQHSEVVFLEPAASQAGMTGSQPFVVSGYEDGLFTLDHDFGPTGVPQGLEFFIVRNHGQGHPYRQYLRALRRGLENTGAHSLVSLPNAFATVASVYNYTVPAGLDTVIQATTQSGSYGPYELRTDQWDLLPGRGIRLNGVSVDFPWDVSLMGRVWATIPATLDGTVVCDLDDVVDVALEYLYRNTNRPAEQAKGQALQAERIKFKPIRAYPNEQRILP